LLFVQQSISFNISSLSINPPIECLAPSTRSRHKQNLLKGSVAIMEKNRKTARPQLRIQTSFAALGIMHAVPTVQTAPNLKWAPLLMKKDLQCCLKKNWRLGSERSFPTQRTRPTQRILWSSILTQTSRRRQDPPSQCDASKAALGPFSNLPGTSCSGNLQDCRRKTLQAQSPSGTKL
jgi:hypothetical protein